MFWSCPLQLPSSRGWTKTASGDKNFADLPVFVARRTLIVVREPVAVRAAISTVPREGAPSDAELVAKAVGGDICAYELLVRRYERSARAACFAILKDWHAAQDASQDAFVSAYANLRSLRRPAGFGPWLLTIAHNRARRVARTHRQGKPLHAIPEPTDPNPDVGSAEHLLEIMASLPEQEKTVVMLRYVDGHSLKEIAQICGRPIGTVSKRLSRAHKRLHQYLTKGDRS